MNQIQVECLGCLVRIKGYFTENPVTPAIPRVTVLETTVNTLIAGYNSGGASQVGGLGLFRGGSTERKFLRSEISTVLNEMSAIARGLDPTEHPGVADRFRLAHSRRNYQALIDTGAAFVEAVEEPELKALFTERGFAADFDTQLTAKLADFADATGRKFDGLRNRKEGTVSLKVLDKKSIQVMKELRSIMVKYLRKNAPALLEVWNAASRIYRGSADEAPAAAAGAGAPSTPAPGA